MLIFKIYFQKFYFILILSPLIFKDNFLRKIMGATFKHTKKSSQHISKTLQHISLLNAFHF
jgi:hypothetical protein